MASLGVAIVRQYERGVVFRLGKVRGVREPGLRFMIPLVDRMRKVSLRTVTMPIQSQQIITRDNVSIGVAAVAYFRRVDPVKSIVEIENVQAAVGQIAQTTVRNVVGRSLLDQVLTDTETLNESIKQILDRTTRQWGIYVLLVELKDIELPPSMQRAMARQAEAEREKRAKIIAAEGEALSAGRLAEAADVIADHPVALQLRNLQVLGEIAVDDDEWTAGHVDARRMHRVVERQAVRHHHQKLEHRRQDLADGAEHRLGHGQQDAQHRPDEIIVAVDDVEGRQPAHDHGRDHDPFVDFQDFDQQGGDGVQHGGVVTGGTRPEKAENNVA